MAHPGCFSSILLDERAWLREEVGPIASVELFSDAPCADNQGLLLRSFPVLQGVHAVAGRGAALCAVMPCSLIMQDCKHGGRMPKHRVSLV